MPNPTAKEAEGLSYLELKALLDRKKEEEVDKVKKELNAAEGIVASLRAQLVSLGVTAAPAPTKRGRKPKNSFEVTPQASKKGKQKRNSGLKDAIFAFLKGAGEKGAHVDDIAKHVKKPKPNINAFLATTGRQKAGIKGKGKRSGIYFVK